MVSIGKAWNSFTNGVNAVEDKAQQAWNSATNTAKDAKDTVVSNANKAVNTAEGVATTIKNEAGNVATNVVNSTIYAADYTSRHAVSAANSAANNIESFSSNVKDGVVYSITHPQETIVVTAGIVRDGGAIVADYASNVYDAATHPVETASNALNTARNGVDGMVHAVANPRETMANAAQHIPDWVPYNNVVSAAAQELAGQQTITLDEGATNEIQQDPAFIAREEEIVAQIQAMDGYGEREFEVPLSQLDGINPGLELGGQRGQTPMADQAKNFYNISDPNIRATWKVAGNELTWLLRHAEVKPTAIKVDKNGNISITYEVKDTLDLRANRKNEGDGQLYNTITDVMGGIWHDKLGATEAQITGTFTTSPVTGK